MSSTAQTHLSGVLERVIFFNEENHYTIAELRPDADDSRGGRTEGTVTIVGPLPGAQCGETLQLTGEWTRHAQHGAQFKVASFNSRLPSSVYGIRKYLGSGLIQGIGKVYANKIVDAFGTDTFRVLTEESGRLRQVPGIGKVRATAIKAAWDQQTMLREVHIFLQTYGVTTAQCVRLVKKYGAQASAVVRNDPYRIAREIDGIGFKTADRIAINLGFANDASPRVDAGIVHVLQSLEEEGHTAFPESALAGQAASLLGTSNERVASRIAGLIERKDLVRHALGNAAEDRQPGNGGGPSPPGLHAPDALIQLLANDRAERRIAEAVRRLTSLPSGLPQIKVDAAVTWAEEKSEMEFHPLQKSALRHALSHKFSILTGGPGTGKTASLRALVSILRAKRVRIHLAAPTGRAAKRLADTTGGFASTIHRLLRYDAAEGGFSVNAARPLATDFLIVDESSMLDTRLAASLLQAVPARAHVLLVGDTDQLPSVGAGNVLKDLISIGAPPAIPGGGPAEARGGALHRLQSPAAIPVTRLEFVYRQEKESLIVTTAHEINRGVAKPPPVVDRVEDAHAWSDLNFIRAETSDECLEKIVELCTGFIPGRFGWLHPVDDVQVLAPMHKGPVGVANLNTILQAALRPWKANGQAQDPALKSVSGTYEIGDKLIQLRNNYDKGLFNGDIGTVESINAAAGTLMASFDGERHELHKGDFGDVALAFAISIHKSQGTEYPVVIIPLLKAHFMMLQRNLVYTAITRGRKKVFLVGDPTAYGMAIRNAEAKTRWTHLREKILGIEAPRFD